ncbi:DUF2231 domain-containing protein [Coralloluteibacterium stylophorae]|uniref:DUF2231 domain-containing protein n=1 Tax=Coralloluteibacterium stylophorae TaxID=1776034 RepID=A0A8J7VQ98_9GAMM|nr:DUF2231 domain-containing protein [Coralloluteibacterium stylophorae]MBS7456888.1 hypothetical protein [Coralloluteibacterium stylophorae]
MAVTYDTAPARALHPFHAFLLAASVPLFLGALLADIAYARSYQVTWSHFASWLLAGGLVCAGVALLLALIGLVRAAPRRGHALLVFVLLLATWVLGFIDSLVHARDAWAVMPSAPVLSAIVTVLAAAATWIGFAGYRVRRTA